VNEVKRGEGAMRKPTPFAVVVTPADDALAIKAAPESTHKD
jgi:hypothetical protein